MNKPKNNPLKSIGHRILDYFIIRRYFNPNPIFDQIDEIMKRYCNIYNEKHEKYSVSWVLKLLKTTSCVRYNRINTKPNLDYFFTFSKISILSTINQNRFCFSHVSGMRITFSSSFGDVTYIYHLKQPLPMFEVRIKQIIAKNPRPILCLNWYSNYPFIRKHTHHEIIFVNE